MIMMIQIPRTTAPPPATPIIILTPLSSPLLCAFLFSKPSSTAAELDGAVVVEEGFVGFKLTTVSWVVVLSTDGSRCTVLEVAKVGRRVVDANLY